MLRIHTEEEEYLQKRFITNFYKSFLQVFNNFKIFRPEWHNKKKFMKSYTVYKNILNLAQEVQEY